jgi:putative SOS response-associated peptidase YedK
MDVGMCGRFQLKPEQDWMEEFGVAEPPDLAPRYNIAPTQDVVAVREAAGVRRADLLRWGLVPSFAEDPAVGNHLINARAETVARKPAFREPFQKRRCLVPADGFYEWRRVGRVRDPYLLKMRDGRTFAFASVWDRWGTGAGRIESCAILTTAANELVSPIHDRMPVMLDRSDYALWLDPDAAEEDLHRILRPFPASEMVAYPVSPRVNSTAVDDPECERPVAEPPPAPVQTTLF